MKLEYVSFKTKGIEGITVVWDAFKSAFPSLEHITGVDLLAAMQGEWGGLCEGIEESSVDGRWPAKATLHTERQASGVIATKLVVTPYIGDRHFILFGRGFYHRGLVACDYRTRPSTVAAAQVIALCKVATVWFRHPQDRRGREAVALFNRPKWVTARTPPSASLDANAAIYDSAQRITRMKELSFKDA